MKNSGCPPQPLMLLAGTGRTGWCWKNRCYSGQGHGRLDTTQISAPGDRRQAFVSVGLACTEARVRALFPAERSARQLARQSQTARERGRSRGVGVRPQKKRNRNTAGFLHPLCKHCWKGIAPPPRLARRAAGGGEFQGLRFCRIRRGLGGVRRGGRRCCRW